jgi:hypothetical protein
MMDFPEAMVSSAMIMILEEREGRVYGILHNYTFHSLRNVRETMFYRMQ